ncbi:DUF6221 family protein [Streptomyces prunicolor]
MNDIAEFLRARYTERQALALAATPGPWEAEIEFYTPRKPLVRLMPEEADPSPPGYFAVRPVAELEGNGDGGVLTATDAEYIAAHGPEVVLADLEVKLSIVARHERCGSMVGYCDDGGHGWDDVGGGGCGDLGDLALPFAAHPDYDERWKP